MRYGRLEWLTPDELDLEQRRVYDLITGGPRSRDSKTLPVTDSAGRLYGPFTPMLAHPRIAEIMQTLGAAIRYELDLTPRSREIATLAVASATRSNFEWYAHAQTRRGGRADRRRVRVLAAGEAAPTFSAEENLVWRSSQPWSETATSTTRSVRGGKQDARRRGHCRPDRVGRTLRVLVEEPAGMAHACSRRKPTEVPGRVGNGDRET